MLRPVCEFILMAAIGGCIRWDGQELIECSPYPKIVNQHRSIEAVAATCGSLQNKFAYGFRSDLYIFVLCPVQLCIYRDYIYLLFICLCSCVH